MSPAGTVKSGFRKGRRFKTAGSCIGSAPKVWIPPSEISIFLHIRTPDPAGTGQSIFRVFILHEIEKPPTLFSAATFTKDEMQAKKLLTFGVHLAMIQPTKTR
ncbi:hypothetical protein [Dysosmobacter sp.]|uniref:hypothetical protein n=1 Tax=Dysosmobacter sp. TaxID=2591382 RepID=UPI00406DB31F